MIIEYMFKLRIYMFVINLFAICYIDCIVFRGRTVQFNFDEGIEWINDEEVEIRKRVERRPRIKRKIQSMSQPFGTYKTEMESKNVEDFPDSCIICFEDYEDDHIICKLQCDEKHTYH